MNKEKYQSYINNFRRRLAQFLKPGIGILCNIYPSDDGGAILEFVFGNASENDDLYKTSSASLSEALSNIEQRAFGGNLNGFAFSGTNTIMEKNRIVFIKESNQNEWSDIAAQKDVEAIFNNSRRASS